MPPTLDEYEGWQLGHCHHHPLTSYALQVLYSETKIAAFPIKTSFVWKWEQNYLIWQFQMAKISMSTYGLFIKKWKSTTETIWTTNKNFFLQNIYLPNFTLYAIILFVLLLLQKFCLSCLWWGLMMSLSNRKRPWNVRPGMIDWRHQLTDFSRKTHHIVSNCLGGILMFCQLSNPCGSNKS